MEKVFRNIAAILFLLKNWIIIEHNEYICVPCYVKDYFQHNMLFWHFQRNSNQKLCIQVTFIVTLLSSLAIQEEKNKEQITLV